MEPERQSPGFSPDISLADFLTDAELAFALQEEEVSRLSNTSIQQSRSTPSTLGTEMYDDLDKAEMTKECQICAEEKHIDLYLQIAAESGCRCLSDVCLNCMMQHIKSQTESKEWKEGSLTCPGCNRALSFQEIVEYADSDTLKTHLSHMIDQTVKDIPNFTRCPNPNCDSGQVHEGGDAYPFVTCVACNTHFCFRHGIPIPSQPQPGQPSSQHENMSCDEYDHMADPMNFRSHHDRQQERAAVERREEEAVARARERMEVILGRRREAAAAATAAADERNRRREKREARERQARGLRERREQGLRERREREQRARLEAERYQEERERAESERRERAEEILLRKLEDDNSERLIKGSTKGCPGCGKRIEKNEGCMHMTCHCGCEFCWVCLGPWRENSCSACFGGPVVQFE